MEMHFQRDERDVADIQQINFLSLTIFQQLANVDIEYTALRLGTSREVAEIIVQIPENQIRNVVRHCNQPLVALRDSREQWRQHVQASAECTPAWSAALTAQKPAIAQLNRLLLLVVRGTAAVNPVLASGRFATDHRIVADVADLRYQEVLEIADNLDHPLIRIRESANVWRRLAQARDGDVQSYARIIDLIITQGVSRLGRGCVVQ